jgi:hypothetical protein
MRFGIGLFGILVLGVSVTSADPQPGTDRRGAKLLPPQALSEEREIPSAARATSEPLPPSLGSTPVRPAAPTPGVPTDRPGWLSGTGSQVGPAVSTADRPGWLSGTGSSVRPAGHTVFPRPTIAVTPSGGHLPAASSPAARDEPGLLTRQLDRLKATFAGPDKAVEKGERSPGGPDPKASAGGLREQPDAPTPFRGQAANGAPVYAGPPAYRWYGWGTVTPGANPYAPSGHYPKASATWYQITGATPGAFPVPVVDPYRPPAGTEPPAYVTASSARHHPPSAPATEPPPAPRPQPVVSRLAPSTSMVPEPRLPVYHSAPVRSPPVVPPPPSPSSPGSSLSPPAMSYSPYTAMSGLPAVKPYTGTSAPPSPGAAPWPKSAAASSASAPGTAPVAVSNVPTTRPLPPTEQAVTLPKLVPPPTVGSHLSPAPSAAVPQPANPVAVPTLTAPPLTAAQPIPVLETSPGREPEPIGPRLLNPASPPSVSGPLTSSEPGPAASIVSGPHGPTGPVPLASSEPGPLVSSPVEVGEVGEGTASPLPRLPLEVTSVPVSPGVAIPSGDPSANPPLRPVSRPPLPGNEELPNWQRAKQLPPEGGEWNRAGDRSRPAERPDPGSPVDVPVRPAAYGPPGGDLPAESVASLVRRLCEGRAEGVEVRHTGPRRLTVCFECRTAAEAHSLVREVSGRPELSAHHIDFCVVVK